MHQLLKMHVSKVLICSLLIVSVCAPLMIPFSLKTSFSSLSSSYNFRGTSAERPHLSNGPQLLSEMHVINFTTKYAYTMTTLSLQGIINKEEPLLFAIRDENDRFWCEYIINTFQPSTIYYYNNFSALMDSFKTNISGIITYNPDNLHTRNIAAPFCGRENAIMAEPELASEIEANFSIPLLEDFNFDEKWDEDEDYLTMYEWVYNNYLKEDKLNENTLALQGPERADLIDLLVRDEIFTLWDIHTVQSDAEELEFISKVFDYYPKNSPILGYPYATGENEGNTVRMISEAGLYLVASDFSSNLAFCSQLDFGRDEYEQDRRWEKDAPKLKNKLYICFMISDGDNLQYVENRMLDLWKQKDEEDEIPVGWSLSPLALKYAPHLVDFFYTNATESDYFIAGPSGAGYIYPDVMDTEAYEDFLDLTDKYMRKLDLSEIWTLGLSKPELISSTAQATNAQAFFLDYAEKAWDSVRLTEDGVPVFTLFKSGITASELTTSLEDILFWNSWQMPLFLPIWVHCWTQDYDFIKDVVEYAEDKDLAIEFVRPDQFIYLFSLHHSSTMLSVVDLIGTIAILALLGVAGYQLWIKKQIPQNTANKEAIK